MRVTKIISVRDKMSLRNRGGCSGWSVREGTSRQWYVKVGVLVLECRFVVVDDALECLRRGW